MNKSKIDFCVNFSKALIVVLSFVAIIGNVLVTLKIRDKIEDEKKIFYEIAELIKDSKENTGRFDQSIFTDSGTPPKYEYSKEHFHIPVLKVLSMLENLEKDMIAPKKIRNKVIILGKNFILKRDYDLYEHSFFSQGYEVERSSKQEVFNNGHNIPWTIMTCLDLFDGKTHCIEPNELPRLKPYQKVSRLYGLRKILWNKDRFCESMSSVLNGFDDDDPEFVFPCWILPNNYKGLMKQVMISKTLSKASFIIKPTDRGEGTGIVIIDNFRDIGSWKTHKDFQDFDQVVVQTYLHNPFLINSRKWDMRIYVLVTSISPLRVYMYEDGLIRFAASVYDPKAKSGGKKTSYLTNTSINKKTGIDVDDLTWPFQKLYEHLRSIGINPNVVLKRIEKAIVKVLLSVEPNFLSSFKKIDRDFRCNNCYQLLGVDVILDEDLQPRVIEVNGEPSMQLSGEENSHYDRTKKNMATDLVRIVTSNHSFSRAVARDLANLELYGFLVSFESIGCLAFDLMPKFSFCVSDDDLRYLLDSKREEQNIGGFNRLYPTKDGEQYTKLLKHVAKTIPYGVKSTTLKVHVLLTELERIRLIDLKRKLRKVKA